MFSSTCVDRFKQIIFNRIFFNSFICLPWGRRHKENVITQFKAHAQAQNALTSPRFIRNLSIVSIIIVFFNAYV